MKLIKLENNNSIYLDSFWFRNSLKYLFIILILLSNSHQQQDANEIIRQSAATTSSSPLTKTTIKQNLLNDEHASMFDGWLDTIANRLYSLSLEYSGFSIIKETYDVKLLKEKQASFAWINFTEMIMNISKDISFFLKNKTDLVNALSDFAEDVYEEYEIEAHKNKEDEVKYQYYDSKRKDAFCDDEVYNYKEIESTSLNELNTSSTTLSMNDVTISKVNVTSDEDVNKRSKKSIEIDLHHHKHAPHRHHNSIKHHEINNQYLVKKTNFDNFAQIVDFNRPHYLEREILYDDNGNEIIQKIDENLKYKMKDTNLTCLNRSVEEYFPQHLKVNRNNSTLHIPVNVFNRDREILHTARWSEALDEIFKENLNNDKELFWQYFCSAHGLFRRYPGALWTTPNNKDFFDCRLQHWYISAAASPKDVIILLDISGSMTGLRLEIAKKLVESLMDTFTDNDFFNILTFSNTVQYLMNLPNETHYRDRLIQAGYRNKLKYVEKLKYFRNTSNMAFFNDAFVKAFELLLSNDTDNCDCNKVIMVITDGTQEQPEKVFKDYNHDRDDQIRLFSFMIGRDMTDTYTVKWMACSNHGKFYHVATLADVNEHVHEYIPVLSRPMALKGVRESTWSNVFIGHVDKELKIAVAMPAFKNLTKINATKDPGDDGETQELLLGVVGIDVPVLTLISKVSPKFQMGVGIYIIMLDNNGYIVFHPSIKEEMKKSENDYKGRSHSVELKSFEIPIENEEDFVELEHRMIDQKTNNQTLQNFKREGIRVVKRETEYVYTPVKDTPFSVAIASPKSFGRYYIDIDHKEEENYNEKLRYLLKNLTDADLKTRVQVYNCSYDYIDLIKKMLDNHTDYCLNYSRNDPGQVVAIKADLYIHHLIYYKFNFSMYNSNKNLVRSYFYGTYSGMTFYLPVTFFHNVTKRLTNQTLGENYLNKSTNSNNINFEANRPTRKFKGPQQTSTTTKAIPKNLTYEVEESYDQSLNLFTNEDNKHTFSFEKQYYTRSIEFSDYMRTEYNDTEPLVIYFLNESSRDTKRDTIGATLSIWLDKVPTAVSGVVYDSKKLQNLVFEDKMQCSSGFCPNICSKNRTLNVTCYLIDEHGVVISSTNEKPIVGLPLYESNPWLMKNLENSGIYNLIIPGRKLNECRKPERIHSSGSILKGLISIVFSTISFLVKSMGTFVYKIGVLVLFTFNNKEILIENILNQGVRIVESRAPTAREKIESNNAELVKANKNCYFFGIYSLNIEKAKYLNGSDFRAWCNTKRYMVGYIKHSNLIMVVAENEPELKNCVNVSVIYQNDYNETDSLEPNMNDTNITEVVVDKKLIATLNRYRKKPLNCYNKYLNESSLLPCSNAQRLFSKNCLLSIILIVSFSIRFIFL